MKNNNNNNNNYEDEEFLRTIGQFWAVSFSLRMKVSQTLQSVLRITTDKYLVRVLVVLLHACFSVVSPIPFLLAAIFSPGHPYIGSTTILPETNSCIPLNTYGVHAKQLCSHSGGMQ